MHKYPIILVVAADNNHAIGKDGTMPWHAPKDLAVFKHITSHHPVIMGSKTWQSLHKKPLPNRTNIVLSRNHLEHQQEPLYQAAYSTESALEKAGDAIALSHEHNPNPAIMVIGGGQIFQQYIDIASEIFLSLIDIEETDPDTFFPLAYQEKPWTRSANTYEYNASRSEAKHPNFAVHHYYNSENSAEPNIDRLKELDFLSKKTVKSSHQHEELRKEQHEVVSRYESRLKKQHFIHQ